MSAKTLTKVHDGALFACCRASEFPAQALLRMRPSLRRRPIAVLDADASEPRVCAGNARSRRKGLKNGMSRMEAEACGAFIVPRRPDLEQSARAAMFATAASFAAEIETCSLEDSVMCVLRFTDTQQAALPLTFARTLRAALRVCGFRVSVALSVDFYTACLLAHGKPGITVARKGAEQAALAPLLLSACQGALTLENDQVRTLASWGVHTFGAVAMLPQEQLVTHLGPAGKRLYELARGEHSHAFAAIITPSPLREAARLEATLARLTALVGEGRVGSPVLRRGSRGFNLLQFRAEPRETAGTHGPQAPRKRKPEATE